MITGMVGILGTSTHLYFGICQANGSQVSHIWHEIQTKYNMSSFPHHLCMALTDH